MFELWEALGDIFSFLILNQGGGEEELETAEKRAPWWASCCCEASVLKECIPGG